MDGSAAAHLACEPDFARKGIAFDSFSEKLKRTAAQGESESGILTRVPSIRISFIAALILATARLVSAQAPSPQAPAAPAQPIQPAPQTPSPAAPQTPSAPEPAQAAPEAPPPPQRTLAVVILDPAHGGTDAGARGSAGISESDIVLGYARLIRISLEAQGMRVLLTRQANDDPSFDDRSRAANAQRNAVFISLHVSSTGQPGTVRVYSLPQLTAGPQSAANAPRGALLAWDRAQYKFLEQSRRLAELIQIQMAQRFHGSPEIPLEAPVRQLRTVGAPAVAIEVSSVSVPDKGPLDQMGPGLADAVARAVAAFRTIYEAGGR